MLGKKYIFVIYIIYFLDFNMNLELKLELYGSLMFNVEIYLENF